MRLLMHERSWARNRAALEALGAAVTPLLINDEGVIACGGAALSVDDARPEAAWANTDTFFSGAGRNFMAAALKSPDLKWMQSGAAGFDNPVFGAIVQKGARLTTSHGQAVGMADYVLWGVLDHFQQGPARRAAQAAGQWDRRPFREMAGSLWTIVGFGAIGRGVAVRARAFGAHVTGVRRSAGADPDADRMATLAELPALLPRTDVLVLACPLTAETRHIGGADTFGRLPQGSVLVNVGRGGLVDEQALLAALERDAPGHAVLDVFETEPLPGDSPFWSHPRVTLTPHSSGMSGGNQPRNDALFLDNLARYLAGEPLRNEAQPGDVLAGQG